MVATLIGVACTGFLAWRLALRAVELASRGETTFNCPLSRVRTSPTDPISLAPAAGVPPSHLVWARASEGRFAYGTYFKDKKVGWIVEETKLGRHDGRPVLFSTSESQMVTLFDGEKSVKQEKSLTCRLALASASTSLALA